jgi:hypothetical protein
MTQTANRLQETLDLLARNPSLLLWGEPVPERRIDP